MPPRRGRRPQQERNEEAPPPPPPPPPQQERFIVTFSKQNPPTFDGLGEPSKAENWIRGLERIFRVMLCTDRERITCATFQLTGAADYWWETRQRTMNPARLEALTWEEFKEEVYNKYVPMTYRRAKVVEFHTLSQGRMTVTEYDRALSEMTRYAPELMDTDEKWAEKFRAGLKDEIKAALASRRGLSYSELLTCALDIEEALPKERVVANTNPAPLQHQQNHREKRRWEGDRTSYDGKRQQPMRNPQHYNGRQNTPYQRGDFWPRAPQCVKCFKNHFGECRERGTKCFKNHFGECRERGTKCFNCGGNGHFSRECPSKNVGMGMRPNNQGFRPQLRALQDEQRGYLHAPPQQQ